MCHRRPAERALKRHTPTYDQTQVTILILIFHPLNSVILLRSILHPIIAFASVVGTPHYIHHIAMLERIQRMFDKLVGIMKWAWDINTYAPCGGVCCVTHSFQCRYKVQNWFQRKINHSSQCQLSWHVHYEVVGCEGFYVVLMKVKVYILSDYTNLQSMFFERDHDQPRQSSSWINVWSYFCKHMKYNTTEARHLHLWFVVLENHLLNRSCLFVKNIYQNFKRHNLHLMRLNVAAHFFNTITDYPNTVGAVA